LSARSILIFHSSADLYGSDQTVIDLVDGLLGDAWQVHVALPSAGPLVGVLEARGASVHITRIAAFGRATVRPLGLLRFPFQAVASTWACLRLIRSTKPQLVHVNTFNIPAPAFAARLTGRFVVWHVHEIMTRPVALSRTLAWMIQILAQRVVCNSEATLLQLRAGCARLASKAVVIPNGVTNFELRERGSVREELQIPQDRFVFLFVGRLNAWKGQQLFVEAATRIAEQHAQALFLVAGDAPNKQPHFREEFLELLEAKGLGERLRFLGFFADTHALYSAANASVVPSLLPEPFGLVAAEAMAASLPVIAADHGGLAEIVEHGVTGLCFEPGNLERLMEAMQSLLQDPRAAQAMGQAGKLRQERLFSVGRYQKDFLQLYDDVLGARIS